MRGPAGIGKTRAAGRGARELASVPVFAARGSELETRVRVRRRAAAARARPGRRATPFHELYWPSPTAARRCCVVDDAHWLDRPSLRWLAFMVNRVADLPLAIVLAARDDEPIELLTRIAAARRDDGDRAARRSRAAAVALARRRLRGDRRQPVLRPRAAAPTGDGTPRSVVDSIALRLERLPPPCRALARALAVLDGMASGTVAARVAGARRAHDRRGLRGAGAARTSCAARLRAPARPRTPSTRRSRPPSARELHAAAARLLQPTPEHVAAQLMAAGPGRGAVDGRAAARRRPRGLGARRAGRGRGAPAPRAPRRRCRARSSPALLRELARALVAADGPDGLPVLREALALADAGRSAASSRWSSAARCSRTGYFADACTAFEAGLAGATGERRGRAAARRRGDGGAAARRSAATARPRSARLRGGARDGRGARSLARAAVRRARRRSRARLPPGSSGRRGVDRGRARRRPRDGARARRGRARRRSSQPSGLAAALVALHGRRALRAGGRRVDRRRGVRAGGGRARDVADGGRAAGDGAAADGPRRRRRGRPARADRVGGRARAAAARLPDGAAVGGLAAGRRAARARRSSRRPAHWPALTGLEDDLPEEFGFTFLLDTPRAAAARAGPGRRTRCGSPASAERRQRAWGFRNPGFIAYGSTLAAGARRERPHVRGARRLRRAGRPRAGVRRAREQGMALRTLGEITGDAATLEQAADVLEPLRRRGSSTPARWSRSAAREPLRAGARASPSAAARPRSPTRPATRSSRPAPSPRRARSPAPPRSPPRSCASPASPPTGSTNREIAETLFLTEKTVEGHLGAAYRKLGINSRAQLGRRDRVGSAPCP